MDTLHETDGQLYRHNRTTKGGARRLQSYMPSQTIQFPFQGGRLRQREDETGRQRETESESEFERGRGERVELRVRSRSRSA